MNYQEFKDYIRDNFAKYLVEYLNMKRQEEKEKEAAGETPDDNQEINQEENGKVREHDYVVEIHQVLKNNGIVLDGLTVRQQGENSSPNLYLNPYFDQYRMGRPIHMIMEELIYRYQDGRLENQIKMEDLTDYEAVKNKIVLRLVNYEKNKTMLKTCPHKRYLDLAVTFRYMADKNAMGIATSLITNQEFEKWNVTVMELYQAALFNTMREFPWKVESLARIIARCLKSKELGSLPEELVLEIEKLEEGGNEAGMFVLTNDTGINGATCILYDNVIRNFATVQEANIFILPSSIHEVMLVPEKDDTEAEFLGTLVREANDSAVGLIDLLSDHIYYYDRERDECLLYN